MFCPFKINWNLGYVVGTIKGDGTTYLRNGRKKFGKWLGGPGYIIDLKVTSRNFASQFNRSVIKVLNKKKLYSLIKMKPEGPNRKPRYRVCFSNKQFFTWYRKLSYVDIKKLMRKNIEFAKGFIRGMTDSEGTVRDSYRNHYIRIANKDIKLLSLIRRFLYFHLKIKTRVYRSTIKNVPIFLLFILKKEYRERFLNQIGTFKASEVY